ncbi:bacitracin ABC transporter ATP-binding protein [Bacillus thuringiensis serovar yunnanensis]|nr:bacitracin ABC transporter ATP-binding protein [Bacillus thuringiensis serovar yunnanensis]
MEILRVRKLKKIYTGKIAYQALSDVNLTIKKGEFVGIMGPSGSGKTTLLNLISTIDAPTSGEILIQGENPHLLSQNQLALFRRKELGLVFQSFNLLDTLTVKENIILSLTLEGVSFDYIQKKLENISKKLDIQDILNKCTYEISRGQAQRTAIARALMHQPKLILADEPTGNLDSKAAGDVMELLNQLNEDQDITMMLVTHDPVVASYCNRVIFIRDGKFYNEIYCGDNRQDFYQKIINILSVVRGMRQNL